MSDDVDKTQERLELEEKIRRQHWQSLEPVKGNGFCLNCGEIISSERRWCDHDCMIDYQRYINRKKL